MGQMVASIQQSHFHASLMLLPGLWYRHKCLVEMQSAVGSLVSACLWNACNGHQGEQVMP